MFRRFSPAVRRDGVAPKNGPALPHLLIRRLGWGCAAVILLFLVGRDFAVGTTWLGDDYLFRAFARLEANPLCAFVSDKHGGEYYRPVPMLLWWLLERCGGGVEWPFAFAASALHGMCAALLILVGRRLGVSRRTSVLSGTLFLVAPAQREAALWFSASTDLLAAAAMLGAMACLLSSYETGRRSRRWLSLLLAAVAFFSKETALVLPFMVALIGWYHHVPPDRQPRGLRIRQMVTATVPYCVVAALYLVARTWVLHGLGGSNDARAPLWAVALQLAGGWVHAVSAYAPLPEWAAWLFGGGLLSTAGIVLRRSRMAWFAALWALLGVLPLPAAGWVVGARYFYFSAAGLLLLVALALERWPAWVSLAVVAVLAGAGTLAANRRAAEVGLYREAVAAAKAAVASGVGEGARTFLVRGAVKDLDLAVKLDPALPAAVQDAVVIPDVPASFVWLPSSAAERLGFLLAEPPLPPAGAYRFGSARIAGLARREEAPDLDEVLGRLPDLHIIRLALDTRPVSWQDITGAYLAR